MEDKLPLHSRVSNAFHVARDRLARLGLEVPLPRVSSVMRIRHDFTRLYKRLYVAAEPASKSLESRLVRWAGRLERLSNSLALYRQKAGFAANDFRQTDGFGVSVKTSRTDSDTTLRRPRAKATKESNRSQAIKSTPSPESVAQDKQARQRAKLRDQTIISASIKSTRVAASRPRRVAESRPSASRKERGEKLTEKSSKSKSEE